MMAGFGITQHHVADILLYITFLAGQLVYIMKRAGFSMRAGRAKSRWSYVTQNWDILAFRIVLQFILIYMPARHFAPSTVLGLVHIDVSNITSLHALTTPISSPEAMLGIGVGSDGLFDWLVDWISRSPKVPDVIKAWLTENVPPTPLVNGK